MKNALSTAIGLSLLTSGVVIASSLPAQADTLTINLSDATNSNTQNYPTVKITLDDTINPGKITATVTVVPGSTGYIGDLRGIYFNLPSNISGLAIQPVSGGPLTAISTNGNFKDFSNSADLQGTKQDFNVGVEIGRQGIPNGDDYQTTTFTIAGNGLTLSAFTSQTAGVRLMSVGDPNGNRELSSKTIGTAPPTVTPPKPPTNPTPPVEPTPPVNPTPPTNPTPPVEPTPPVNPTPPTNPTPPVEPTPPVNPTPPTNPTPPVDPPPPGNPPPPSGPVCGRGPAPLAGFGLVAGALGISRHRQSKKKA